MRRAVLLVVVAAIGIAGAAILVSGCGTASSSAPQSSPSPIVQPPDWLLEEMARLARNAGDPEASAWWTLTTADKAVVVNGDDAQSPVAHSNRAVYVFIVHGDFTRYLWSYPVTSGISPSPPQYSWVFELIDAKSRWAIVQGNSCKPFDTTGLTMHSVVLPDSESE